MLLKKGLFCLRVLCWVKKTLSVSLKVEVGGVESFLSLSPPPSFSLSLFPSFLPPSLRSFLPSFLFCVEGKRSKPKILDALPKASPA